MQSNVSKYFQFLCGAETMIKYKDDMISIVDGNRLKWNCYFVANREARSFLGFAWVESSHCVDDDKTFKSSAESHKSKAWKQAIIKIQLLNFSIYSAATFQINWSLNYTRNHLYDHLAKRKLISQHFIDQSGSAAVHGETTIDQIVHVIISMNVYVHEIRRTIRSPRTTPFLAALVEHELGATKNEV